MCAVTLPPPTPGPCPANATNRANTGIKYPPPVPPIFFFDLSRKAGRYGKVTAVTAAEELLYCTVQGKHPSLVSPRCPH
jgi:hypothetical protein